MLDLKVLSKLPRIEQVRRMTEAMREIDPIAFDKTADAVRGNVSAAMKYTPHIFIRKH